MKLIKINLLPYRELREQKQKKQLQLLLALGAVVGLLVSILIYAALAGAIASQNSRNESLETGIKILDKELAEIKELNEQKRNLLARKQKVEELDVKRFEGARIIDSLDELTPEGVYLISIEPARSRDATDAYILNGKATSDNRVAIFMERLPSTGVFEIPELINIKKGSNSQEFTLSAKLVKSKPINVDTNTPTTQPN